MSQPPSASTLRFSSSLSSALGELLQPFRRQFRGQLLEQLLGAFEVLGEHAVEAVEVPLVLHHRHAREVVELFGGQRGDPRFERLEQREEFGQRHRHAAGAQIGEEADQHRARRSAARAAIEEHELLEQVHVLLVLEQRAVQRPGSASSDRRRAALRAGCPRRAVV